MSVTANQLMSLFNDCELGPDFEAGTLPTINAAKLTRLSDYLTKLDPDTFGTDAAAVTPDQFVVLVYNTYTEQIRNIERSTARQTAVDAVDEPEEF